MHKRNINFSLTMLSLLLVLGATGCKPESKLDESGNLSLKAFKGEEYEAIYLPQKIMLISEEECEFQIGDRINLCKYTKIEDGLRLVNQQEVLYFKSIQGGYQDSNGIQYLDPAHATDARDTARRLEERRAAEIRAERARKEALIEEAKQSQLRLEKARADYYKNSTTSTKTLGEYELHREDAEYDIAGTPTKITITDTDFLLYNGDQLQDEVEFHELVYGSSYGAIYKGSISIKGKVVNLVFFYSGNHRSRALYCKSEEDSAKLLDAMNAAIESWKKNFPPP